MGQTLSTPEKILKLAKSGDYVTLKDLLAGCQRHEPDFQRNRGKYLEVQRDDGSTPLTLAAERGHFQIVELLLQYGANIHHMDRKGDGGTALHEAVAHKHEPVVDLLMRSGANPLIENIKGFTAMDIACADKNVTLLRRTEQAAVFRGWLMMKVQRFGGLGSEWQRRWCVICHRYPYPGAPPGRQVTHLVFLAYRSTNSTVPACRVWLDGARAAEVYNAKAIARVHAEGGPAQIGVTLHRKHDSPAGAYYTGSQGEGFTFFLRPDDGSRASVTALAVFSELVNNKGQRVSAPPAQQQQPVQPPMAQYTPPATPQHAGTPSTAGSTPMVADWPQFQPLGQAPPLAQPAAQHSDEEYARRLQAQYDAETAGQAVASGAPALPPEPSAGGYPAIVPMPGGPAPTAGAGGLQQHLYPSLYPDVAAPSYQPVARPPQAPETSYPSYTSEASSAQPSGQSVAQPAAGGAGPGLARIESSSAPSAPPMIDFTELAPMSAPPQPWWADMPGEGNGGERPATAAPAAAAAAAPQQPPATAPAAAAAAQKPEAGEDDSNICVICMEEEASAGFLHGDSVHRCLCKACAAYMKESKVTTCPMCRQNATAIINIF